LEPTIPTVPSIDYILAHFQTGVLGGGGPLGLGRDPGVNLAGANVLGGGGGVACCCGVGTLADIM